MALVTTAAPYQADKGDQGPGAAYNAAAKFYSVYSGDTARDHDLRISHVAIDREHTTAADASDLVPVAGAAPGRRRRPDRPVAPRFHGVPTNRSHRATLQIDAPEIVARCLADEVDAAVLVANCPVCHQTVSLVARALEAEGIATVVMGCAKDIVEYVGVPRFAVLGLSARQRRRPAARSGIAGADARLCAGAARSRAGAADHAAVAAALERRRRVEGRLLQHRAAVAGEIARRRAEFDAGKATAKGLREQA